MAEAPPASDIQFTNWGCCRSTKNEDFLGDYGCYTDPLSERSSVSRLSARSLEMCTENLGSETGIDTISGGGILSASTSSFDEEKSLNDDQGKLRNKVKQARNVEANSCRKFPPPLTTMSVTGSIQVRRHCEGGRLIIEAVERPLRNSYLQAERSGGRLRLCYLTDSESESDVDDTAETPREEEEEEVEEGGVGLESGAEEYGFQRLSRCKERVPENVGLCRTWKSAVWVATS
ncbi:protein FANTASTIC FOUR 3-like [Dorcoceras hygrometricum]|uniref:Protein FANTASTIC FOUR 3-like n=1 Tax=Dorcoceras hygrometricum TaxID=472368 RepID=A0A2Z7BH31_9LAMI|nr:protein FANTASTIC FOUR 3-like [Dorcoceras hygrometricum]